MSITLAHQAPDLLSKEPLTFAQAQQKRQEMVWTQLAAITIEEAMSQWLLTLSLLTAKNYTSTLLALTTLGIVPAGISLREFALLNHDAVIDRIKLIPGLSEATKQARAACYISFTRYLNRRSNGLISVALPCREGTAKTFFKVREKVQTRALNQKQWLAFLNCLKERSTRDYLIAKLSLQGAKRANEVLSLTTEQIDFAARTITFWQSKTKGYAKTTVITYPQSAMDELQAYLDGRLGLVFITANDQPVHHTHLHNSFVRAGEQAGLALKVTPHVLRASAITYLKSQGFSDSDIMKVSGHASAEMVNAYDLTEQAHNASQRVSLV